MDNQLKEARGFMRHAMQLERESKLLSKAGYYDAAGNPRTGEEGGRIWDTVQKEMAALPPFTDAEVDAALRREANAQSGSTPRHELTPRGDPYKNLN